MTQAPIRKAVLLSVVLGCIMHPCSAQSDDRLINARNQGAGVEVQLSPVENSSNRHAFTATIKNHGKVSVYVVTNPRRSDQSIGPYIDVESIASGLLVCTLQFYPANPFGPVMDWTGSHLVLLKPGEKRVEFVLLTSPLRTTIPPFPSEPRTFDIPMASIRRLRVQVGVIPISDSLMALMKQKIAPHDMFSGTERVEARHTTKSLYELQEVVLSNAVEISDLSMGTVTGGPQTESLVHESGHADPPKPQ